MKGTSLPKTAGTSARADAGFGVLRDGSTCRFQLLPCQGQRRRDVEALLRARILGIEARRLGICHRLLQPYALLRLGETCREGRCGLIHRLLRGACCRGRPENVGPCNLLRVGPSGSDGGQPCEKQANDRH